MKCIQGARNGRSILVHKRFGGPLPPAPAPAGSPLSRGLPVVPLPRQRMLHTKHTKSLP